MDPDSTQSWHKRLRQNLKWPIPGRLRAFLATPIPTKAALLQIIAGGVLMVVLVVVVSSKYANPFRSENRDSSRSSSRHQIANAPTGFSKLNLDPMVSFFQLTPEGETSYGIGAKQVFTLASASEMSLDELRPLVTSSVPLSVTQTDSKRFQLQPIRSLQPGEELNIGFETKGKSIGGTALDRDFSWAYQALPALEILQTLPADKSVGVPLEAGIEIVFNQDQLGNATDFVSIDPPVKYRLEPVADTLRIIPQTPLEPRTNYTVTIKPGFRSAGNQNPLATGKTFVFQTKEQPIYEASPFLEITKDWVEVSPRDKPMVRIESKYIDDKPIKMKLFRVDSVDEFVESRKAIDEAQSQWWRYYQQDHLVDTSKYHLQSTAEVTIQEYHTDSLSTEYVEFPEALTPGLYLAQLEYDKLVAQAWIQSSFLTGHVSVGRKDTLVWLNATDQEQPVHLASVRLVGSGFSATTNQEGVASFATPTELFSDTSYLHARTGDDRSLLLRVASLDNFTPPTEVSTNDYWSYLYHERISYKPGDMVKFWGVIRHRETGQVPEGVVVSLGNYQNDLHKVTVSPRPDGSFVGQLQVTEDMANNYFYLKLSLQEKVLERSSIQVSRFIKPELKIEVEANKKAIQAGESVKFRARVTFFDGTAAGNIPIKVNAYSGRGNQADTTLRSDASGWVEYLHQTKTLESGSNGFRDLHTLEFSPQESTGSHSQAAASVWVFQHDLLAEAKSTQQSNQASLQFTLNYLDLDSYNQGKAETEKGLAANAIPIELQITRSWYTSVPLEPYYDPIEKITRTRVRYQRQEESLPNVTIHTNQSGQALHQFEMQPGSLYRIKGHIKDKQGRVQTLDRYFSYQSHTDSFYYRSNQDTIDLKLKVNSEDNVFGVGETVKLAILKDGQPFTPESKTKILYNLAKEGRQQYQLTNSPQLEFGFGREHAPNVSVSALVFDGTSYHPVRNSCQSNWTCDEMYYYSEHLRDYSGMQLFYDKTQSELTVKIESSATKYKPGDVAEVTVSVHKQSNPVAGASVNLVLLDETMVEMHDAIEPTPLNSLYQTTGHDVFFVYSSHARIRPQSPGAEGGGGGGGGLRDLFLDTAFFGTAVTDEAGNAKISIQLPDNITTWVAYAQAVTSEIDAGNETGSVVVTQPFFATSSFPVSILSSDQTETELRSFGEGLQSGASVEYRILVNDQAVTNPLTLEATKPGHIILPSLKPGQHVVETQAVSGEFQDRLALPLEVLESRHNIELSEYHSLVKDQLLQGIKVIVDPTKQMTLHFSDTGKGLFYHRLRQMCQKSSNRVEMLISKNRATPILKEYFDDTSCRDSGTTMKTFQQTNGGISQVKWGEANLETTVWALASGEAEALDLELVKKYLEANRKQSRIKDQIFLSWGWTLLGDSRVTNLQRLVSKATSFEDKVLLGIALADTGNTELAADIYWKLLSQYGYKKDDQVRIQAGETADAYILDSALTVLLSSYFEGKYGPMLYTYIRENRNQLQSHVIDAAEIVYIEQILSKLPDVDTSISITAPGISETVTLSKGASKKVSLPGTSASSFVVKVVDGAADVIAEYGVRPVDVASIPTKESINIKREVRNVSRPNQPVRVGDIVKVSMALDLKDEAPTESYMVKEFLPSGLTYIDNPKIHDQSMTDYWTVRDQQFLEYWFYNSDWWKQSGRKNIQYLAKASYAGNYTWEPAVLQSQTRLEYIGVTATPPQLTIERNPQ